MATNNKPASAYVGRAKEGVYAQDGTNPGFGPNRSKLDTMDLCVANISTSAGGEKTKTDGVKIRGTGAATKGTMARGPMA